MFESLFECLFPCFSSNYADDDEDEPRETQVRTRKTSGGKGVSHAIWIENAGKMMLDIKKQGGDEMDMADKIALEMDDSLDDLVSS